MHEKKNASKLISHETKSHFYDNATCVTNASKKVLHKISV